MPGKSISTLLTLLTSFVVQILECFRVVFMCGRNGMVRSPPIPRSEKNASSEFLSSITLSAFCLQIVSALHLGEDLDISAKCLILSVLCQHQSHLSYICKHSKMTHRKVGWKLVVGVLWASVMETCLWWGFFGLLSRQSTGDCCQRAVPPHSVASTFNI